MRSYLRASLESELDVMVNEACNGFEALRILPRETFDVVVTDINMPDIHGLEVISFMRSSESHRDTPVVIVSTEGSVQDRQRGLSLGADAYLTKPFEPEQLVTVVREVLASRGEAVGDS